MLFLLTVFFLISISSTLLYLLLSVFVLKSILSDISIVTPAFFGFLFTWNIFFHLSLLVCVSLHLPGITCRYESGGSFHSSSILSFEWKIWYICFKSDYWCMDLWSFCSFFSGHFVVPLMLCSALALFLNSFFSVFLFCASTFLFGYGFGLIFVLFLFYGYHEACT